MPFGSYRAGGDEGGPAGALPVSRGAADGTGSDTTGGGAGAVTAPSRTGAPSGPAPRSTSAMILRNGPEFGTNVLILRTLFSSFSFSSGANGILFHLLVAGSRISQHTSFSKPFSQLLRFSTAS